MMDTTPKELCDLNVCTSQAEARRRLHHASEVGNNTSRMRLQDAMIQAMRKRIAELEAERRWYYPDKGEVPPDNTYVLAHTPDSPWRDEHDKRGVFYRVVKFVRCEPGQWVNPNNKRGYVWREFGSGSLFGQEVAKWRYMDIAPEPPEVTT